MKVHISMEINRQNGTVITIFSTASAVGKTFLAVNMAAELARIGYKICLIDLDLQFGDVGNYLALNVQKTLFDLLDAMKINSADIDIENFLTPYEYKNISFSVLPSPTELDQAYNISAEGVRQCTNELQKYFDYILIDTASTFSRLNLAVMDLSTIITFVGIVDFIPTIKNMKIGYDTMRSIGYGSNKIRLILNRSDSKTNIALNDVQQVLGEKFYHIIPNDFTEAQESIHAGIPLAAAARDNPIKESIRQLIGRYTNRLNLPEEKDTRLSGWMKRIFKQGDNNG